VVSLISAVFTYVLAGLLHGCCTERCGTQLPLIVLPRTRMNTTKKEERFDARELAQAIDLRFERSQRQLPEVLLRDEDVG
jgi:hypothetical protein